MNKVCYKIYHANLAFSAIETSQLAEVIDKCYFPLLDFIKNSNTKVGLEISGYSLEIINNLRPNWLEQFKSLNKEGLIELIGSGYMQIIGPTVPYEVNIQNQKIGLEVYKKLLNLKPTIVFVNEQTFSKSMVDIYVEVGYKAIVMEWNNFYSSKSNLNSKYSYSPVVVEGINSSIPIIWSDTILFQQYQRTIHNQQSNNDYFSLLEKYTKNHKCIPIYTSDLEIFNFRPGRFETEELIKYDEWIKIDEVTKKLKTKYEFVLPSIVLEKYLESDLKVDLVNDTNPIIVKKQDKYSLSRWMACGRGANFINTQCFRYFYNNKIDKKLLQYWGSDYRTHITEEKWKEAIDFFKNNLSKKLEKDIQLENDLNLKENDFYITFEKDNYKIVFNRKKGLTLKEVVYKNKALNFGTVSHGDFDYISNGADFYTGTSVIESASTRKVANLSDVKNYEFIKIRANVYQIKTKVYMKDIAVENKVWTIDLNKKELTLYTKLDLKNFVMGSIRLAALTLTPQLKKNNFWYECKNGGDEYEQFKINCNIKHSKANSLIQSSSSGLGVTDGILKFGVNNNVICEVKINRNISVPYIMLENNMDENTNLTRVFFSVQELDDTLKYDDDKKDFELEYSINIDY